MPRGILRGARRLLRFPPQAGAVIAPVQALLEARMVASESDILAKAEEWAKEARGVALATVVETWGSAPRPVGSHLVIDENGSFLGSVSGGCVEGEVVTEAMDVIETGKSKMLEFGVADETAWRAGLSCGGRIRVYVEKLD
jgi:xanthine/CO dehydrogenase XdhC/CoxF family maturation factor